MQVSKTFRTNVTVTHQRHLSQPRFPSKREVNSFKVSKKRKKRELVVFQSSCLRRWRW